MWLSGCSAWFDLCEHSLKSGADLTKRSIFSRPALSAISSKRVRTENLLFSIILSEISRLRPWPPHGYEEKEL